MKRTQKAKAKSGAPSAVQEDAHLGQFEFLQVMGKGAFGRVFKANEKQTGAVVAVKQILEDESMMNRETQVLQQIGTHASIISLKHFFYSKVPARVPGEPIDPTQPDRKFLNLVTDFMPITLAKFNQVSREEDVLSPGRLLQVKQLMHQFLAGLAHIHSLGIAHRDIKPDNILIDVESKTEHKLKICDFGSAKQLNHHNYLSADRGSVTYISTRYYRGPELLYGNPYYGIEIDLWAAGCVLAEMFTRPQQRNKKFPEQKSYTLFRGDSNVHQLALILSVKGTPTKEELLQINPQFKQPPLQDVQAQGLCSRLHEGIPKEAVDLISKLLSFAPMSRITAKDAMKHEFFADLFEKPQSNATSASSTTRKRQRVEVPQKEAKKRQKR